MCIRGVNVGFFLAIALIFGSFFVSAVDVATPVGFSLTPHESSIALSWLSSAENVLVWRAYDAEGPWFIHEVVAASRGRYEDTDIEQSTRYYYRVQGLSSRTMSGFSETLSALVTYDEDIVLVNAADDLSEVPEVGEGEGLSNEEYEQRLALYNHHLLCKKLAQETPGVFIEAGCDPRKNVGEGTSGTLGDLLPGTTKLPDKKAADLSDKIEKSGTAGGGSDSGSSNTGGGGGGGGGGSGSGGSGGAGGIGVNEGRGFVAVCDDWECVTVPVLIERGGERWQLGYYPEEFGVEKARLSYRSTQGKFMSVDTAFSEE